MKTKTMALLILALLFTACSDEVADEAADKTAMASMSAEDHAHMHGGMGGATEAMAMLSTSGVGCSCAPAISIRCGR